MLFVICYMKFLFYVSFIKCLMSFRQRCTSIYSMYFDKLFDAALGVR